MAVNLARYLSTTAFSTLRRKGLQIQGQRSIFVSSFLKSEDKEDMDNLKQNPYFDKYADKIAKLQKSDPQEFLDKMSALEDSKKPKRSSVAGDGGKFSLPSKPKSDVTGGRAASMVSQKTLADKMKIELLEGKSADEIAEIWREYHAGKDSVAAVIPADTWKTMHQRFQEHKTFLFPLPRQEGYEFIMVQFEGNEAHFTTLINYQAYHENAPECLTLIHYTDLLESKGIVLMEGVYNKDVLSAQEAQCLANQVGVYYSHPSEVKRKLLETFTHHPDQFKHNDLIEQMENISFLAGASEQITKLTTEKQN